MSYVQRVLGPGVLLAATTALAFLVIAGSTAGWSALGGGLAVVLLLASTPLVLGPVATVMPGFSVAAAVTFYLTKVAVLAMALVVISAPDARAATDTTALGSAAIVTTVGWTILLVVAELRSRRPTYDLPDPAS